MATKSGKVFILILVSVVVILVAILLLRSSGTKDYDLGKEIELRNGIHFGDDVSTVRSKETGTERDDSGESRLDYNAEVVNQEAHIQYYFHNNALNEVYYSIPYLTTPYDTYDPIKDSLIRQYGEPNSTSTTDYYIIEARAMGLLSLRGFEPQKVCEWVVTAGEKEKYKVKIELVLSHSQLLRGFFIDLCFYKFDDKILQMDEQIRKEQQEYIKQQEEEQKRLEQDIIDGQI